MENQCWLKILMLHVWCKMHYIIEFLVILFALLLKPITEAAVILSKQEIIEKLVIVHSSSRLGFWQAIPTHPVARFWACPIVP